MNQLSEQNLQPLNDATEKLSQVELIKLQEQLPDWQLISYEGIDKLQRIFTFDNFSDALDFTQRVGKMADYVDHHPAILTEWGSTTVTWWTHSLRGLQHNDFIMAARTDSLYA